MVSSLCNSPTNLKCESSRRVTWDCHLDTTDCLVPEGEAPFTIYIQYSNVQCTCVRTGPLHARARRFELRRHKNDFWQKVLPLLLGLAPSALAHPFHQNTHNDKRTSALASETQSYQRRWESREVGCREVVDYFPEVHHERYVDLRSYVYVVSVVTRLQILWRGKELVCIVRVRLVWIFPRDADRWQVQIENLQKKKVFCSSQCLISCGEWPAWIFPAYQHGWTSGLFAAFRSKYQVSSVCRTLYIFHVFVPFSFGKLRVSAIHVHVFTLNCTVQCLGWHETHWWYGTSESHTWRRIWVILVLWCCFSFPTCV